jgi:hypothetical protein
MEPLNNETAIVLRPTRLGFLKTYALVFLAAAGVAFVSFMGFNLSLLGLAVIAAILLIPLASVEFRIRRFVCRITEDEIVSIHGFVKKWRRNIRIESLVDMSIYQNSFLQTLFNFGSIKISSWTSEQDAIEIPLVRKPQEVMDIIDYKIKKRRAERQGAS